MSLGKYRFAPKLQPEEQQLLLATVDDLEKRGVQLMESPALQSDSLRPAIHSAAEFARSVLRSRIKGASPLEIEGDPAWHSPFHDSEQQVISELPEGRPRLLLQSLVYAMQHTATCPGSKDFLRKLNRDGSSGPLRPASDPAEVKALVDMLWAKYERLLLVSAVVASAGPGKNLLDLPKLKPERQQLLLDVVATFESRSRNLIENCDLNSETKTRLHKNMNSAINHARAIVHSRAEGARPVAATGNAEPFRDAKEDIELELEGPRAGTSVHVGKLTFQLVSLVYAMKATARDEREEFRSVITDRVMSASVPGDTRAIADKFWSDAQMIYRQGLNQRANTSVTSTPLQR